MKNLITICFLFIGLNAYAQSIEVIGAYSQNNFLNTSSFSELNANAGSGHSLKIAFTGKKINRFLWRFTVGYDNYRGEINSVSGVGRPSTYLVKINKSVMTLGVFPFNKKIRDKMEVNLGVEISNLFGDGFEGTFESFNFTNRMFMIEDIKKVHRSFNANVIVGLSARLAYDFKIAENIYLSPQYALYLGLTSELRQGPVGLRSFRHNFGLGMEWKL